METEYFPNVRLTLEDRGYIPGSEGQLLRSRYASSDDDPIRGVHVFPVRRGPRVPITSEGGYDPRDTHITIRPESVFITFGTDIRVLTALTQAQWNHRFEATSPGYVIQDVQTGRTFFLPSISFDLVGPISKN